MILAIDFSQHLVPPPQKKSPWEHDCIARYMYYSIFCHKNLLYPHWLLLPIGIIDYKYFRGAFNTLWQIV